MDGFSVQAYFGAGNTFHELFVIYIEQTEMEKKRPRDVKAMENIHTQTN